MRAQLTTYGKLVLEANRRFNLTGAQSSDEMTRQLLDSLTLVPYILGSYVDVGAGAGLPAIPVSLALDMPATMIEATAKKARFLRETLDALSLRGTVVARRAERVAHQEEFRERFQSGTARAVGGASTVAELLLPFIVVGGVGILQRGSIDTAERRALGDAALMLGAVVEEETMVAQNRRLLVVRKLRPSPARFPRRPGVPAKRPLCS